MARIWNKYPYTDFHELNADWILDQLSTLKSQVDEFTERVIAMEDDVADLKTRITSAEGRLTTAEADIDALEGRAGSAEDRLDAIEGSDIMDAVMLSDMAGVTHGSQVVQIDFTKFQYTDGVRGPQLSDNAVLYAATDDAAGVMVPAQKKKLDAFTVDTDGNAVFSGTVAGDTPAGNNDFATKQYVDSIVISGGATVTYDETPVVGSWRSSTGTVTANNFHAFQYGNLRQIYTGSVAIEITSAVSGGGHTIAEATLKHAYLAGTWSQYNKIVPCLLERNGSYSTVFVEINCGRPEALQANEPVVEILSISGADFAAGDILRIRDTIVYLTL